MLSMSRPASCREKGFTPVEFLVSIGVIGVVAAVSALGLGHVTVAGRHQADRADRQALETAEEAWTAHQVDTVGYATETVLLRSGFLPEASVRSVLCLTPAPPGAPGSAGTYFVLPADPLPTERGAGDSACTDAADQLHLPGPAIASAGTAAMP
jgi:Tfp pilus assembly protein PilE